MAQVVSEAVLRAKVEGEGDVKALNKAFQDLGKTSGKTAAGVGDAAVNARARKAGLNAVSAVLSGAATGATKAATQPRLITRMRTAIGNMFGAATQRLGRGAQAMGGFASKAFTGIGKVATGAAAVARFGVAAGGVALKVFGVAAAFTAVTGALGAAVTVSSIFIGTLRAMTSAYRWAIEEAAAALDTYAKIRRTGADWNTVENRSALAQQTIGDGWEEINNRIIKTFTPGKIAKGLGGDKMIFQRWGITPAKVAAAEKRLGRRMDVTDWMQRFAAQREQFDQQIAKLGDRNPKQVAAIQKRREQLDDDITKMFGPAFAEGILKFTTKDMQRILEAQNRAGAVGPQNLPGETDKEMENRRVQNAKDLTIAMGEMTRTFGELTSRIAVGVQPAVTRMVEAWTKLAQTDASQKVADLVTALANKGFETVISAIQNFDPSAITKKLEGLSDWISSFDTASVGESLGKFATSLLDLPEKLGNAASGIMKFIDSLNRFVDWISTLGGLLKTDAEKKAIAEADKAFESTGRSAFGNLINPPEGYDRLGRRLPEGPAIPANLQQILDDLAKPQAAVAPAAPALDQNMFDSIFDQGGATLRGAASDIQSSLVSGGSQAAGAFNAGMTFAGADAAGTRLGQAAVAVIAAGVSGMRIGIAPGPVPSMVRAPAPSVGADSPVTP